MPRLTLDRVTLDRLRQMMTAVELVDDAGNVVGHFLPLACGRDEPHITEEELDRRASEPGRPLADILADLEKRA